MVAQIAQMAARNQIALVRIFELLGGIGARRFEQPVAHRVTLRLGQHQRLIDQRRQHVEDVELVKALITSDRNCPLKREAADEDPQPPEEHALALVEQVVTPVNERAQRLLARQHVAPAAGEHAKTLVEPVAQLFDAEHLHACRRQLDRQAECRRAAGRSRR